MIGGHLAAILAKPIAAIIKKITPNPPGGMIFKLRIDKVYMRQYEGWVEMWVVNSYSYQ